jgi:hypothetical protein
MEDKAISPQVLASDTERERAANLLGEATGEGRLTLAEYSDRVAAVYASRTRADLEPLLADLPQTASPAVPTQAVWGRRDGVVEPATPIGAIKRGGRWRLDRDTRLKVTLGPIKLDLRGAEIAASEVNLHVVTWCGSVKVWIPAGVRVVVDGHTTIGTRTIAEDSPHGPGPVLHLRIDTTVGAVKVYRV